MADPSAIVVVGFAQEVVIKDIPAVNSVEKIVESAVSGKLFQLR